MSRTKICNVMQYSQKIQSLRAEFTRAGGLKSGSPECKIEWLESICLKNSTTKVSWL